MTYNTHSTHAPTGADANAKVVVSPNEYAPEGRTIGYPSKFDLYVVKISDVDGSTQVSSEPHSSDQLVGNRLYLNHRPIVDPTGGVATVTSSDGTVLQGNTNAKQGYIEYQSSDLPAGDFTTSYQATPDCFSHWQQNKMQDSIMEVEAKIGPNNQTGWKGLRNVKHAIFDKPDDEWNELMPNLESLPHLGNDIRISSSDDSLLTGSLGAKHTVQVGRRHDSVNVQATGISLGSADGFSPNYYATVDISTRTGDKVFYAGTLSGFDQLTIGGAGSSVAGYSGVQFSADMSGDYYTGAMLQVHGDIAAMGNIKAFGTITLISTTGETSTVLGDFTIRDELFVYGISHLIGPTETNELHTFKDFTLDQNLVAGNINGNGDGAHTLIDNLDASEVAHTYKTITRKNIDNYIISAPSTKGFVEPKRTIFGGDYTLSGHRLVGDVFQSTGFFTQAASFSGAHQSILQLQWKEHDMYFLSGFFSGGTDGVRDGAYFSKGYIDPGSLWVEILNGQAKGYKAPIYGYRVEETITGSLTKLNVFTPSAPTQTIASFDEFMLYMPGCESYDFLSAAGGASPTVTCTATEGDIQIAFEDEVRVLDEGSSSSAVSLTNVLDYSVSGMAGSLTGIAYVFASRNNVDIEDQPAFLSRATPFRMPGETIVGEVVATDAGGSSWTINEVTSYRPGGLYDSAWIPISQDVSTFSGRVVSKLATDAADITGNRFYFNHNLGADLHFSDVNAELYLGNYGAIKSTEMNPNAYRASVHSMWGADFRHPARHTGANISEAFNRVSLSNVTGRDASVFYMDGKVMGVQLEPNIFNAPLGSATSFDHLRLIVKRTS